MVTVAETGQALPRRADRDRRPGRALPGLSALAAGRVIHRLDLGLTVAACVAAAGCLIALIALPSRDNRASRDGS